MLSIQRVKPTLNIVSIGRGQILFSYDTPVAIRLAHLSEDVLIGDEVVKKGTTIDFVTEKYWSRQTQGHINWFFGTKEPRKTARVISQEKLESWNGTVFELEV